MSMYMCIEQYALALAVPASPYQHTAMNIASGALGARRHDADGPSPDRPARRRSRSCGA